MIFYESHSSVVTSDEKRRTFPCGRALFDFRGPVIPYLFALWWSRYAQVLSEELMCENDIRGDTIEYRWRACNAVPPTLFPLRLYEQEVCFVFHKRGVVDGGVTVSNNQCFLEKQDFGPINIDRLIDSKTK